MLVELSVFLKQMLLWAINLINKKLFTLLSSLPTKIKAQKPHNSTQTTYLGMFKNS